MLVSFALKSGGFYTSIPPPDPFIFFFLFVSHHTPYIPHTQVSNRLHLDGNTYKKMSPPLPPFESTLVETESTLSSKAGRDIIVTWRLLLSTDKIFLSITRDLFILWDKISFKMSGCAKKCQVGKKCQMGAVKKCQMGKVKKCQLHGISALAGNTCLY